MATDDRPDPAGDGSSPAGRDYGITLWQPGPDTIASARITGFARWLGQRHGLSLAGYRQLWQWSVNQPGDFWAAVWDYLGVLGDRGDGPVLSGGPMPEVTWFAGSTLDYARNALATAVTDPDRTAVTYRSEAGPGGTLSYGELAAEVARVQAALRELGVGRGDRVAAYLPNIEQALIGLLAAASPGAIWSSCSPDFAPGGPGGQSGPGGTA